MNEFANWGPPPERCHIEAGVVHVWRIPIDPDIPPGTYWKVLSAAEHERAQRLRDPAHRTAYVLAHGAMRMILADYVQVPPSELSFDISQSGKPAFARGTAGDRLEFNLAHSGDVALLAVARDRAVGVDVERWDADMDHTAVAAGCFSPAERDALRAMAGAPDRVVEGFYAAWTRKEAYLKASGHGVSHGLDHFDVSLAPGQPAALLADRRDADAVSRWVMVALAAGVGYSAALVVATPVGEILLFDVPVR